MIDECVSFLSVLFNTFALFTYLIPPWFILVLASFLPLLLADGNVFLKRCSYSSASSRYILLDSNFYFMNVVEFIMVYICIYGTWFFALVCPDRHRFLSYFQINTFFLFFKAFASNFMKNISFCCIFPQFKFVGSFI